MDILGNHNDAAQPDIAPHYDGDEEDASEQSDPDYSSIEYSESKSEDNEGSANESDLVSDADDQNNPQGHDSSDNEQEMPAGVDDLLEAIDSSDEDLDLGGFRHFLPIPKELGDERDDNNIELSDPALARLVAGWFWPTGTVAARPRTGELAVDRIAKERLMMQEVDLIPCLYCANMRCSKQRHFNINIGLNNKQEEQEMSFGKYC